MSRLMVKTDIAREALSEFMGTFILVFFNIAGPLSLKLSGVDNPLFALILGGIGVFLGILTSFSNSGSHLNPAVTTSFAVRGMLPWKKVPHYIAAQYLGSFLAAAFAFVNFAEGITALDGGHHVFAGGNNATGIFFATYPNANVSFVTCVFDTMFCSALLLFMIAAIIDQYNSAIPGHLWAIYLAAAVVGIAGTFGYNCGSALNPARDFGPRLFTAIAGYGSAGFTPQKNVFWLVATVVPHLGGFLGIQMYHYTIGLQKPGEEERIAQNKLGTLSL